MHVDALAQVLQRALADPADEVGLGVGRRPVGGNRADEDGDDDRQRRLVSLSDAAVDRATGEIGRRQRCRRCDQQGDEHPDHLFAIRPQQSEQPAHLAPALILASDQAPDVAEHQQRAGQPAGLVGLIVDLLGNLGPLRLGISLEGPSRRRGRDPAGRFHLLAGACSQPRHSLALLQVSLQEDHVLAAELGDLRIQAGSARSSSSWLPRSTTRPASMTTISSASEIVERRWATTKVVRPAITSRKPFLISSSVRASTDEVASSRIRMRGSAISARAIAIRWRWPPESVSPRSPTIVP